MKLKLLDANKAAAFGLPQEDTDRDFILADYGSRGWEVRDIMHHIQTAIDAGAYEKKEEITYQIRGVKPTPIKRTGGSEDTIR
jgi:hypothetical protein